MAKLIDPASRPSTRAELDLFTLPPTQVAIERSYWREFQTSNPISNSGPYDFFLPSNPQLLDVQKNYVLIELCVKKNGNTKLEDTDKVAPINLIGKTLFKSVKLNLNGTEVFNSGDKYAFRAMIETELGFDADVKDTNIETAGYTKERAKSGKDTLDHGDTEAFLKRQLYFGDSKVVQICAPLHIDLFRQDRYLINNVDVRITLERNSDDFCLLKYSGAGAVPDRYSIQIVSMKFYVRTVEIAKPMLLGLEHTLQSHTAKYPIKRVEVKSFHVAAGLHETPRNNVFAGQIPRRIVVGFVSGAAYNGALDKNPFNFLPFDVQEINVVAGGVIYPFVPFDLNFEENRFTRAYMQYWEAMGGADENSSTGITMRDFKYGHTLFVFNLTPDDDTSVDTWALIRDGATCINAKFRTAIPPGGIEAIVHAEFDNLITMDRNRNTFTDFNT